MPQGSNIVDVYVKYANQLKRYIGKIVGADDVDDIVQEAFVKSYEAELKKEITFARSYMLQTARHLALNHVNKWDNKFNESIEDLALPPVELLTRSTEKDVESKERFLLFCQAAETLSEQVRKAFLLKKVYGLSQKEIAQQMQLSESTVEKHIAKGLLVCFEFMQDAENDGLHQSNSQTSIKRKQK